MVHVFPFQLLWGGWPFDHAAHKQLTQSLVTPLHPHTPLPLNLVHENLINLQENSLSLSHVYTTANEHYHVINPLQCGYISTTQFLILLKQSLVYQSWGFPPGIGISNVVYITHKRIIRWFNPQKGISTVKVLMDKRTMEQCTLFGLYKHMRMSLTYNNSVRAWHETTETYSSYFDCAEYISQLSVVGPLFVVGDVNARLGDSVGTQCHTRVGPTHMW